MAIEQKDWIGAVIDEYEILSLLGRGAMGAVYLAQHRALDRQVAIKFLPAHLAADESGVARFWREAKSAAKLNHPNIVHVYDFLQVEDTYCYVMEYVSGKSLGYHLRINGRYPESEAITFLYQACEALAAAHKVGIIHRDVKPDNFMLTEDGVVKLGDLGLVRIETDESNLTVTGSTMGTPYYISPEQLRCEKDIDGRADLYSLGATMYHVITGEVPFTGSSAAVVMSKHLSEPMPWPKDRNPDLSNGLCYIVAKMMTKERQDRYGSASEILTDLERLEAGKSPLAEELAAHSSAVIIPGDYDLSEKKTSRSQKPPNLSIPRPEATTEISAPSRSNRFPIFAVVILFVSALAPISYFWVFPHFFPLPTLADLKASSAVHPPLPPPTPVSFSEKPQLAILPFSLVGANLPPETANLLADLLAHHLNLKILETASRSAVVRWLDQNHAEAALLHREPTKAIDFGRATAVQYLVLGELTRSGEVFSLAARLVDCKSGNVTPSGTIEYHTDEERMSALAELAVRLKLSRTLKNLPPSESATSSNSGLVAEARALLGQGKASEAQSLLKKGLSQDPNQPNVKALLAQIQSGATLLTDARESFSRGNFSESLAKIDKVLQSDPNNLEAGAMHEKITQMFQLLSDAKAEADRGNFTSALGKLDTALQLERSFTEARESREKWDWFRGPFTLKPSFTLRDKHRREILSAIFDVSGKHLWSASPDGVIQVWELESHKLSRPPLQVTHVQDGHNSDLTDIALGNDDKWLATSGGDKTIKLWDAGDGHFLQTLGDHTDRITALAFIPKTTRLVSASADKTLKIWDISTGKPAKSLVGHTDEVLCVAVSPDGKRIASGSADATLKLWDAQTGNLLTSLKGHDFPVLTLAWGYDNQKLVSSCSRGSLLLWDTSVSEAKPPRILKQYSLRPAHVGFLPDGRLVTTTEVKSGKLNLWSYTDKEATIVQSFEGQLHTFALSPDAHQMAAASDRDLLFFDLQH